MILCYNNYKVINLERKKMSDPKTVIRELLTTAGVQVDGSQPWDIQVHDDRFYNRILRDGSLGLGESYMDGWWDCDSIDAFIDRVLRAKLRKKVENNLRLAWHALRAKLLTGSP